MKTRILLFSLILACFCLTGISQVPNGFNYQAVARDANGMIIASQSIQVKIGIQTSLSSGTIYEETFSSITTSQLGLINLVVGTGSATVGTFSAINWNQTLFLKTSVKYPGSSTSWTDMGTSQIWSVPYALIADKANGVNSGTKLSVTSANDAGADALFEVKRADGQTVFAVYPNAVNVYVPKSSSKGAKGGFAVGGFDGSKGGSAGTIQDYLRVTPDSVRIYVDPNPTATKGSKGGFAVGGYDETKGISSMYFNLTPNSTVNTVDASPQILWYPTKNAFLAGNIHIGHVDSVGNYSTALGYQSRAIGDYSQAFGYKATAFGNFSTSIGKYSIAGVYKSKNNAFALGNASQATGEDSYAFGSAAIASGEKSFAFGSVAIDSTGHALTTPTTASGLFSTAIGMGAQATNTGSLAFGNSSLSNGYASLALGFYSSVLNTARYGVAIGYYAQSNGDYGQAFGLKANARAKGSLAIGPYATTGSTADYAGSFGYSANALAPNSVAIGYNAKTAATATSAGAFGYNAVANGVTSVAIGSGATTGASATDAGAFGKNATANGVGSVAIGPGATTGSSALNASSFGYNAAANGFNSVAVGFGASTGASADNASSFGKSASATGASSMALGVSASAIGSGSIAIGNIATSNGQNSTSLGSNTTTSVDALYSTALGYGSSTTGLYATALGYNAQANGAKSISIGAYYDYWYRRPTFYYDPILHRFIIRYISTHITKNNIANDDYSVAIGNGNESDNGGFTFGSNNYARSEGAVAIGHSNSADSSYSFTAGYANNSNGIGAFALGENLIAQSFHSFVIGDYNLAEGTKDEWVTTEPLFVVGNGTGSRSNALVVAKNGNTTINGDLTVTGTISSYVGTGDGLGNHTASQNLKMNGYWVSNDGGNEGLWVSTTGAVGIGNSSPSYTLDVSGSIRSTGSIYSNYINPDNNGNLTIDAGTLYIDGTSNRVGVNNTAPSYSLDITGTFHTSSNSYFGGDLSLTSASPALYFNDNTTGEDDFKFEANADALVVSTQGKTPVNVLGMSSSGAIAMPSIGTGTGTTLVWNSTLGQVLRYSSSIKYKTDINALTDYSWLYNLTPVNFLYKSDTEKQRQYGLIAEDVVKVNKSLVFYKDGEPDAVNYNGLIAPLIKAVQDQKKTIEALQVENSDLKTRLEKLESIVSNLNK
jgi:hypothetical protein